MQLLQEVRVSSAACAMPEQAVQSDDDADEQRDASVGAKYSGHDYHRVYHTYQDDWSDFENEIRSGRQLTTMRFEGGHID